MDIPFLRANKAVNDFLYIINWGVIISGNYRGGSSIKAGSGSDEGSSGRLLVVFGLREVLKLLRLLRLLKLLIIFGLREVLRLLRLLGDFGSGRVLGLLLGNLITKRGPNRLGEFVNSE